MHHSRVYAIIITVDEGRFAIHFAVSVDNKGGYAVE
jgi:hypothetical protein